MRNLQRQVVEARKRELDLMINSWLLTAEAKKRGNHYSETMEIEVMSKVKPPNQPEVQTFFDQNKARIKGDFVSVKEDIVRYPTEERQRAEAKKVC